MVIRLLPGLRAYGSPRYVPTARHSFSIKADAPPLRMAVIGSGPAGFYTASGVLGQLPDTKVDIYESLPVPFGLTRFGFAPDHPDIPETSQAKWTKLAEKPNFQFIGNVTVGGNELEARPGSCQITLATVLRHYDIITFAYGASEDRTLGVPGESLEGVYSAREFVGWYNGLPSKSGFTPDLTAGEEAVIIGQGNVAIDVARMLLKSPSELQSTDISEEAIESLSRSRVKRIKIVGRRGPMQAKFTRAEIRGLLNIPGVALHPIDDTVVPPGFQGEELQNGRGKARRLFQTLLNGSRTVSSEEATKTWSLEFCLAPHRFLSNASNPSAVKCTMFRRTQLSSPTNLEAHVIYTEEFETFNSSLVFRSIGYKSVPLEGFNEAGIAFDAGRGVIKTDGKGRVLNLDNSAPIPGLYCSGWLNTGATGVIGDTMAHSHQTATAISRDVRVGADLCRIGRGPDDSAAGWEGVKAETPRSRLSRAVTWQDWKKINEAELKNGKAVGKKRLKFTTTSGMLAVLD